MVAISISKPTEIIDEVIDSVNHWPEFANKAGMDPEQIKKIGQYHRTSLRQ